MGWSYSGNPSGSSMDAVRFLIQDTNSAKQLVQDEEIEFILTQEMNIYMAGARICRSLVVRAGGISRKRISDFDISYNPRVYAALAGSLEARGLSHQIPYAGGISVADKQAQQADVDWVQPSFTRNLDNNPEAPSPDNPVNGGSTSGVGVNRLTDS